MANEHLHIGYHLTDRHDAELTAQCQSWFRENAKRKLATNVIAESLGGTWQIKGCARDGTSGPDIAAYLGKDEPDATRSAWGKVTPNLEKRCLRHPMTPGLIVGTERLTYRHGTSRNIAPVSKSGKAIIAAASDAERLIPEFQIPY